MNVPASRFYGGMAHPSLDDIEFCACFERMCSETVTQGVDPTSFGDPCFSLGLVVNSLGGANGHGAFFVPAKKQPFAGLVTSPIFAQEFKAMLRQDSISVFTALALFNSDHHPA